MVFNSFVVCIILIGILDLAGTMFAKTWAIKEHPLCLIGTFLCFGVAGLIFAKMLKFEGLAVVSISWDVMSIVFVALMSYFYFHEDLSRIQIAGIVTVLTGMVMLHVK